MCGIAGFVRKTPAADPAADAAILTRMTRVLRHRGPDDSGTWMGDGAGLAHTRLSIIDLSPLGHQPMSIAEGRYQIVYNGEIYNFRDLRAELEAAGVAFRSESDTEVILHAYARFGPAAVEKLNGMFALAIWDRVERRLFLARDRIGKKPLCYAETPDAILFGSEIKALLCWPGVSREPDYEAIDHYLALQYVPAPLSAFKGVRKLPPGCTMTIDASGASAPSSYWSLPEPAEARRQDRGRLAEELVALLHDSVRIRMISDVPLGAFLSGGVDSSSVVAMMARASNHPVKTFCIGFEESGFDERAYARAVARRVGADHHEEVVRPDAVAVLPKISWHYNEPYADPSAVPTYYVSQLARRHVTVALNGDGGDEFFLGYGRYRDCRRQAWVDRLPAVVRGSAGAAARAMPACADRFRPTRVARRLLKLVGTSGARRYEPSMMYFYETDKQEGYAEALREARRASTLDRLEPYFAAAEDMLTGAAWADIHTYLPDDLLVKVDIASMAHSLEARSPLLDHRLMEWASRVAASDKYFDGEPKALLKQAMEPYLPRETLYRPKMGFGVPIERWLSAELKDFAHGLLTSGAARARGLFKPEFVERQLREHWRGERLHHTRLWGMLMLELWFRMWIDDSDPLRTAGV